MASSYRMLQRSMVFELATHRASREANIFVVVKSRFNPLDLHLQA